MNREFCPMRIHLIVIAAIILGIAAAGAQSQESSSRPQKQAERVQSKQSVPPSDTPSDPANANSRYVIGPGDLLAINVLHEPEVSQKVPVRMDGKITMPLIGEIQANGMMPDSLQAAITEKLHEFIKDAEVTVVVEEMKSRQFNVMGEVQHPGSFPLLRPTRVLDALAQAGGFRDFARVTKVHVLRRTPQGTTVTLPFNYKEVTQGKNDSQNIELQAGDTVIVP